MNAAAVQGPGGPGNGQSNVPPNTTTMYRPEMMRTIQFLTDDERVKYEKGLTSLWTTHDAAPLGSPAKEEAKKKIVEFGRMLFNKIQTRRQQMQMQRQQPAHGVGAQVAQVQGQPTQQQQQRMQQQQQQQQAQQVGQMNQMPQQLQQGPPGQQQQQQPTGQTQQARPPAPGQPNEAGTGLPPTPTTASMPMANQAVVPTFAQLLAKYPSIQSHLNEMVFTAPANHPSPERWVEDVKGRYGRALIQMEQTRANMAKFDALVKARKEKGMLSADEEKTFNDKKMAMTKQHQEAHQFIMSVRGALKKPPNGNAPPGTGPQGAAQARPSGPARGQAPGQPGPAPGGAPALSTPMQSSTAAVNAAIEAAKNQQLAAGRPPQGGGLAGPQSQAPTMTAQSQPLPVAHPHQAQATPVQQPLAPVKVESVKVEPGTQPIIPAPLNTAIASGMPTNLASGGTPTQNSARIQTPQSAATPTNPNIRPLTHAAAISLASQNPRGTPGSIPGSATSQQPGHTHAHPAASQTPGQIVHTQPKMPIPKVLPEKATQIPTPVPTIGGAGAGRPTYSGGSSIAGGVMNQPVIPKVPAYVAEGEGERVLNKKKLDELVRQVCGGTAEGQDGNLLTPEVEESVLDLADNFVDHVLQTACRMAKARGSKVLEIRDIQLVLERQYNIRIPGYSSEELRTVRKAQPNPQWITKMSAVQAAKVMPGKGDL